MRATGDEKPDSLVFLTEAPNGCSGVGLIQKISTYGSNLIVSTLNSSLSPSAAIILLSGYLDLPVKDDKMSKFDQNLP